LSRWKQEKRWLSCASQCPTPYDNYNGLVVGFCPGMRPSEAILSIAVMPRFGGSFVLAGKKTARSGRAIARRIGSGQGNSAHCGWPETAANHQVCFGEAMGKNMRKEVMPDPEPSQPPTLKRCV
jgi:hypothetical protein